MRKFAVRWTQTAEEDVSAVLDYLSARAPQYAIEAFDRLKQKAAQLAAFPHRGCVVPELKEQGIVACRELICLPWRIICRIEGDRVWVLGLIDSRRNVEDILLERFLR